MWTTIVKPLCRVLYQRTFAPQLNKTPTSLARVTPLQIDIIKDPTQRDKGKLHYTFLASNSPRLNAVSFSPIFGVGSFSISHLRKWNALNLSGPTGP